MLNERDLTTADIERWVRQGKSIKAGRTWYTVMRSTKRNGGKLMLGMADWELNRGKKMRTILLTYEELLAKVNKGSWMVKINDKPVGATAVSEGIVAKARKYAAWASKKIEKAKKGFAVEKEETRVMMRTFFKLLRKKLNLKGAEPPTKKEVKAALLQLKDVAKVAVVATVLLGPIPGDEPLLFGLEFLARKFGLSLLPSAMQALVASRMRTGGRYLNDGLLTGYIEAVKSGDVGGFIKEPLGMIFPAPFTTRRRKKKKKCVDEKAKLVKVSSYACPYCEYVGAKAMQDRKGRLRCASCGKLVREPELVGTSESSAIGRDVRALMG